MPFEYNGGILECCGLSGIYRLTTPAAIAAMLKEAEDSFRIEGECNGGECCGNCEEGECCGDCNKGYGPGICIATTADFQDEDGIGDILKKYGFSPVLNTLNPNSGNRITLWVKDLSERKVSKEIAETPTQAPNGDRMGDILLELHRYVEANPNPRSASARALVNKYNEHFSHSS